MNFIHSPKSHSAFTLIELLVVMGIIGVLMAVTILVINPNQNFQKARDTTRISDLNSLNTALNMYVIDTGNDFSSPDYTVYVSLPDSSPTCAAWSLPALPTSHPWVYHCSPSDTYRKIDGTGWIPVNFTLSPSRPLSTLPIDPTNNATYYYSFVKGGSFELNAITESQTYKINPNNPPNLPGVIAMGTNLNLSPIYNSTGLVGYWNFDETSGTTAIDSSGYGNTGTLMNGPTRKTGTDCKVGGCLSFDGSSSSVNIVNGTSLNITSAITIEAMVKPIGSHYNGFGGIWRDASSDRNRIFVLNNGSLLAQYYINGVMQSLTAPANSAPFNKWTHIAFAYDGSTMFFCS